MSPLPPLPRRSLPELAVAVLTAAMLLLCSLAAIWHPLHERLHPDCGSHDDCAAVVLAQGQVDFAAVPPVLPQPRLAVWPEQPVAAPQVWIESLFGLSWVQEHAPPARG